MEQALNSLCLWPARISLAMMVSDLMGISLQWWLRTTSTSQASACIYKSSFFFCRSHLCWCSQRCLILKIEWLFRNITTLLFALDLFHMFENCNHLPSNMYFSTTDVCQVSDLTARLRMCCSALTSLKVLGEVFLRACFKKRSRHAWRSLELLPMTLHRSCHCARSLNRAWLY